MTVPEAIETRLKEIASMYGVSALDVLEHAASTIRVLAACDPSRPGSHGIVIVLPLMYVQMVTDLMRADPGVSLLTPFCSCGACREKVARHAAGN